MKTTGTRHATFKQSGLTLVEILVALLLGLFLIAGVSSLFLSNKQTYTLNESLSRLQEDGRFVTEIFGSRLRSAGYAGCYGDISQTPDADNILNSKTNFSWDVATPLQGFNNVAANATLNGVPTTSIAGTDALAIKGLGWAVPIASTPNNTSFTIDAANNRFSQGEILFVANCDQASLFQATSITTAGAVTTIQHTSGGGFNPGNATSSIANAFNPDAQIGRLETFMYNIQPGANGSPALWERRLVVTGGNVIALTATELIPNTTNMQLAFGIDTSGDGDADIYQDASVAFDWRNVVSVRFALLLEGPEDNQIPNPESYSFNAATFTYVKDNPVIAANSNRRFRRIFSGVVALRNRVL